MGETKANPALGCGLMAGGFLVLVILCAGLGTIVGPAGFQWFPVTFWLDHLRWVSDRT